MDCAEVFERMPEKFKEFDLKNIHGVFQFHISGNGGGQWHSICRGDYCEVHSGVYDRPDVAIWAGAKNVVKMAEGRLNPYFALATRRVKVKGNLVLLAKVQKLLAPMT